LESPQDGNPLALSVDLTKHEGAEDSRDVGQHVALAQQIHRLEVRKTRRAQLAAIRFVSAVGDEIDAEFALGRLDGCIDLTAGTRQPSVQSLKWWISASIERFIAARLGTTLPSVVETGPTFSLPSSRSTHWRMILADWRISSMRMR
jgi:hypothetical protein